MLLNRSRGTLMSHFAQRRFKSNTPFVFLYHVLIIQSFKNIPCAFIAKMHAEQ